MRLLPALLPLLLLGGCKAAPDLIGLAAGYASGGATANPAVGFAVGVGVSAAADQAVKWYGRSRQHAEQDALARRVGAAPLGGTGRWHIHHLIPLGDEHGEFEVVRLIPSPLAACKEIVFSVIDGRKPDFAAPPLRRERVRALRRPLAVGKCGAGRAALGVPAIAADCAPAHIRRLRVV